MVLARTVYVFFKLLPTILALRKDRVLWISNDGKNVDQKRLKKMQDVYLTHASH